MRQRLLLRLPLRLLRSLKLVSQVYWQVSWRTIIDLQMANQWAFEEREAVRLA